ncbi:MAG: hypothetical protein PHX93_03310 [Candidatus Peribacteraceae bacterium]|jgi:hypothetical protein|nr:hypothetical protein [Candidatus Peribacteraceae bacterium]
MGGSYGRLAMLTPVMVMCAGFPVRAAAQRWDYLFENLTWSQPPFGDVGNGGGFMSIGGLTVTSEEQNGGFWDYLSVDLQWPDGSFANDAGTGAGG